MSPVWSYLLVAAAAFLGNIPCGSRRAFAAKFSPAWFFWIHASIPVIILMRIVLGVSPWFIPAAVASAVAGQIVGVRRARRRASHGGEGG